MRFNPDVHHRRSSRMPGYDYARDGAYFVTVCTHNRELWFGVIVEQKARLSAAGHIVEKTWLSLPERFAGLDLDAFVVMPNHVHGILVLVGAQFIAP